MSRLSQIRSICNSRREVSLADSDSVQNPCPKSTSLNRRCQRVLQQDRHGAPARLRPRLSPSPRPATITTSPGQRPHRDWYHSATALAKPRRFALRPSGRRHWRGSSAACRSLTTTASTCARPVWPVRPRRPRTPAGDPANGQAGRQAPQVAGRLRRRGRSDRAPRRAATHRQRAAYRRAAAGGGGHGGRQPRTPRRSSRRRQRSWHRWACACRRPRPGSATSTRGSTSSASASRGSPRSTTLGGARSTPGRPRRPLRPSRPRSAR
jgi:hypothetical protein